MTKLTQEYLRTLLKYNPETGAFTWLVTRNGFVKAGRSGGHRRKKDGYRVIVVEGTTYLEGRLAWFYVTGTWPRGEIDHKNRIKEDSRWDNLRDATKRMQWGNHNLNAKNKTGVRGVYRHSSGKFIAKIGCPRQYLGRFTTLEEAKAVYDAAAEKYFGATYYSPS